MRTDMATVLPLPQHRDEQGTQSGRAGVRLEITRRGRSLLTVVAFVLGLAVAAALLLMFDVPSALAGSGGEQQLTITVEAGDTLWDYAELYAPEGVSEQEFIAEARTLNHLPTGRVTAGQEIELPVAELAAR
jgi:hypothetical protein